MKIEATRGFSQQRNMAEMIENPQNSTRCVKKWLSDLDWRLLCLIVPLLSLIVFASLSSAPIDSFLSIRSLILNRTLSSSPRNSSFASSRQPAGSPNRTTQPRHADQKKAELDRSRIAVCLVGGARRLELTGPSIVERVLKMYPNADLFLHSPVDNNAFKLSLLKSAPRIASVRIFKPDPLPQTDAQFRVLTRKNSPNGIQGLLQYFNLVEGCLTMIRSHQNQNNFTYDWIVRTRVDGYWNAPLSPQSFIAGKYTVPSGSVYGGLNDRLGIGDFKTSEVALSRLTLIPLLDSFGFHQLNSESAFKAQLTTVKVPYVTKRLPFCVVTDRRYEFPPARMGVPVAALSSPGPLSGAKCRPCTVACEGPCVADVMSSLEKWWSWTNWENRSLALCNAHDGWERGWEKIFDSVAGKKLAAERQRVQGLEFERCVADFIEMKKRASKWESPPPQEICRLGLGTATQR